MRPPANLKIENASSPPVILRSGATRTPCSITGCLPQREPGAPSLRGCGNRGKRWVPHLPAVGHVGSRATRDRSCRRAQHKGAPSLRGCGNRGKRWVPHLPAVGHGGSRATRDRSCRRAQHNGCPISARLWQMWESTIPDRPSLEPGTASAVLGVLRSSTTVEATGFSRWKPPHEGKGLQARALRQTSQLPVFRQLADRAIDKPLHPMFSDYVTGALYIVFGTVWIWLPGRLISIVVTRFYPQEQSGAEVDSARDRLVPRRMNKPSALRKLAQVLTRTVDSHTAKEEQRCLRTARQARLAAGSPPAKMNDRTNTPTGPIIRNERAPERRSVRGWCVKNLGLPFAPRATAFRDTHEKGIRSINRPR
jgi:hypothetical protein